MKITIDKDAATKFNLNPMREQTDNDGNIVLKRETYWSDCVIYEDIEDGAICMEKQLPGLYLKLIEHITQDLKRWKLCGFKKFYQVVMYDGLSKFDNRNCYVLCTLCKKPLLASIKEKGDALVPFVLPPKLAVDPVVVLVMCVTCATKTYKENPENLMRKEIFRIILSDETRWIKNDKLVDSPLKVD